MSNQRKIYLAANWKMNLSLKNLQDYFDTLKKNCSPSLEEISQKIDITLAVPSLFLTKASEVFSTSPVKICAQNVHWEDSGAFTGELSCRMLKEAEITTSVIGHSERRKLFHESNEDVTKKFQKIISEKMTPILCVGETKEERESKKTFAVLGKQMKSCLANLDKNSSFIVAYEPVWAIGTGLTASKEQAQEAHKFIREWLKENINENISQQTRILYGGSMKPEVTQELLSAPDIDGGLVGGASLDPEKFAKMLNIAYAQ